MSHLNIMVCVDVGGLLAADEVSGLYPGLYECTVPDPQTGYGSNHQNIFESVSKMIKYIDRT